MSSSRNKKKHLFLILCLFLLIPLASASTNEFQVTVPSLPSWFEITYSPSETVINYSLNSSVNYASTYFRLWGTNNDIVFTLVNESEDVALVAHTPKYFPIICSGFICTYSFSKYYLELWHGFTDPAATLNLTFITQGDICGGITFLQMDEGEVPGINRIAAMGVVMGGVCWVLIAIDRRRKKKKKKGEE